MEFEHAAFGLQGIDAEVEFAGRATCAGFVHLNDADESDCAFAGENCVVEDKIVGKGKRNLVADFGLGGGGFLREDKVYGDDILVRLIEGGGVWKRWARERRTKRKVAGFGSRAG